MRIKKLKIKNFRSIDFAEVEFQNYSLIIGPNNAGKTNIIDAIRIFYDKDIKFDEKRDIPKHIPVIDESWIEIEYQLTENEYDMLEERYKKNEKKLRLRRYFKSLDKYRNNSINLYYIDNNGNIDRDIFYGWRKFEDKLGEIIYIPALTKIEEEMKLSGSSPFRQILTTIVKDVAKKSKAYQLLQDEFDKFNEEFKKEKSPDGLSLIDLIEDINKEIQGWNVSFKIDFKNMNIEDIVKNMTSYSFFDNNIQNDIDVSLQGHGLQRQLIFTVLKLMPKFLRGIIDEVKSNKNEVKFDMTLILYEEPEVFLHPSQQEILNRSFKEICENENHQVIITTHSPCFVSRNIEDIISIVRVNKEGAFSRIYQINSEELKNIFELNINGINNVQMNDLSESTLEREEIRYLLYLDTDRCCAFFADLILLCEGLSEKGLIEKLMEDKKIKTSKAVYIFNSAGKYNIHRFMNLFDKMGLYHSVLFDRDLNNNEHAKWNNLIETSKNRFTVNMYGFEDKLGVFLGHPEIDDNRNKYKKPILWLEKYRNGEIEEEKLDNFTKLIEDLIE